MFSQSFFFFFSVSIVFRFTRAIIIVSTHFSCWTRESFYESFLSYYIHPRPAAVLIVLFWPFGLLQLRSLNEHRHRLGEGIVGPDGGPVFQTSARLCRNRRPNGRRNRSHPLLRFLQGSARVSLFFFSLNLFQSFGSLFWTGRAFFKRLITTPPASLLFKFTQIKMFSLFSKNPPKETTS